MATATSGWSAYQGWAMEQVQDWVAMAQAWAGMLDDRRELLIHRH